MPHCDRLLTNALVLTMDEQFTVHSGGGVAIAGLFGAKVLAAHCVHVDDGEMRALKSFGAGIAHNPTSNLKLGASPDDTLSDGYVELAGGL